MPPVDRSSPDLEDPRTYNLTSAEALACDIHSVSNQVYNLNFFAGFHAGKAFLRERYYETPSRRRQPAYPVDAATAYRRGFNLALIEMMMRDGRMVESNGAWFDFYAMRWRDQV